MFSPYFRASSGLPDPYRTFFQGRTFESLVPNYSRNKKIGFHRESIEELHEITFFPRGSEEEPRPFLIASRDLARSFPCISIEGRR